jgi:hypothetical protein
MSFDTPVLLLVWRRPHAVRAVIDAIRPIAPTSLFVACDGPHPGRPGEAKQVAAILALIERSIDWSCQIEHLYSETNQGCRLGVSPTWRRIPRAQADRVRTPQQRHYYRFHIHRIWQEICLPSISSSEPFIDRRH